MPDRNRRHAHAGAQASRGALIVAGHDVAFLRSIGITRWLRLTDDLLETDPM